MSISGNFPSQPPTLLLDFANSSELDPRITFTRASTATYYDGQTSALAEQNLTSNSQNLAAYLIFSGGSGTATANAAVAPDGTTTATSLTPSNGSTGLAYYANGAIPSGTIITTVSIYAKANGMNFIAIGYNNTTTQIEANLISGLITVGSGSIVSVGNGWYRIVCAAVVWNGYTYYPQVRDTSGTATLSTSDGVKGIYVWGAQSEQRSNVTSYTATSGTAITNYIPQLMTAANNVPRFDHDPTTGQSLGLFIEEQRTNLFENSNNIGSAFWFINGITVASNAIIAPDGTQTASSIVANSGANQPYFYSNYSGSAGYTVTATINYTYSFYVKRNGTQYCRIINQANLSNYCGVQFDFNTLTFGSIINVGDYTLTNPVVTSVGNGWYRLAVTIINATRTDQYPCVIGTDQTITGTVGSITDGNEVKGLYVWGAQKEQGSFTTSYIPTTLVYSGRASTGTYLAANGYIQTAAANTQRFQINTLGTNQILLETSSSNQFTWTNNFSQTSQWYSSGTAAIITPRVLVAPDGTYTGDLKTGGNLFCNLSVNNGFYYTISVYAKNYGGNTLRIQIWNSTVYGFADYNLVTGTTGGALGTLTTQSASITNAGNGWYRCTYTFVSQATETDYYVFSSAGVYLWGAQGESGGVATSYIPAIDTFTSRSSNATYYNASTTALAEQNLLTYSQDFTNAIWLKNNGGVGSVPIITANYATAPNGTSTAARMQFALNSGTTVNDRSYISNNIIVLNTNNSGSIWLKSNSGTPTIQFRIGGAVLNQTITTTWARYSILAVNGGDNSFNLGLRGGQTPSNTDSVDILVWGPQVELRSAITSYTATTSTNVTNYIPVLQTATNNVARYDYDPITRISKGLLVEPSVTNFLSYSTNFSGGNWYNYNCNTSINVIVSPDGTLTGTKLYENTANAEHYFQQFSGSGTVTTWTSSVYAKAGERNYLVLDIYLSGQYRVWFNLANGTIGTISPSGTTATITSVGNGWYRCTATRLATSSVDIYTLIGVSYADNIYSYAGDGYSGIYLWGAQMEQGTSATSYIPTPITGGQVTRAADVATSAAQSRAADVYSSATATRNADNASMTGTNFSSWFNPTQGTFFGAYDVIQSNCRLLCAYNNTTQFRLVDLLNNGSSVQYYSNNGANFTFGGYTNNSKLAGTYSNTNYSGSINGLVQQATPTIPLTSVDTFGIGNYVGIAYTNGHIKKLAYWPQALTNTQLQALTKS